MSTAVIRGVAKAIEPAQELHERGLIPAIKLEDIVFLAGAAHVEGSRAGLQKILEPFEL